MLMGECLSYQRCKFSEIQRNNKKILTNYADFLFSDIGNHFYVLFNWRPEAAQRVAAVGPCYGVSKNCV